MTCRQHAESWMQDTFGFVPPRDTRKYAAFYSGWIDYAFATFGRMK